MASEIRLSLKYIGPGVDKGMNAYLAAEAIQGFAEFAQTISQVVTPGADQVTLQIKDFSEGSSFLDFALTVATVAAPFAGQADTIFSSIKSCIELLIHLRGEPPKNVRKADGGSVYVENNSGNINVFNGTTVFLVTERDIGKNAEKFIRSPLRFDATHLDIAVNDHVAGSADKDNFDYFRRIKSEEALIENRQELYLTIASVVLEGDGMWKFSDGRLRLSATIEDNLFLESVKSGRERFGRGDTLKVVLRSTQTRVQGALKSKYVIEKVLEHIPYTEKSRRLL